MAPRAVTAHQEPSQEWLTMAQTKKTIVENKADPAAKPIQPIDEIEGVVTATTHSTVKGKPRNQGTE